MMLRWIRSHRILILRVVGIFCLPIVLFTRPSLPDHSWGRFALESGGLALLVMGALSRVWSRLYIGGRKSRELVTTGPYSICRNPLYLSALLTGLGVVCVFKNVLLAVPILAFFPVVYAVTVRGEERYLSREFGDAFRHYARSVPRLFPAVWKYRDGADAQGLVPFDPKRLVPVFGHAAASLLFFPAAAAIEELQVHGILPVLMSL